MSSFGFFIPPLEWLGSAAIQSLNDKEQAVFVRLLIKAMVTLQLEGKGLPDDERKLANLGQVSLRYWRLHADAIRPLFYSEADGTLHHRWTDEAYEKYEKPVSHEQQQQRADAAKARWQKKAPRKPPASQGELTSAKQVVNGSNYERYRDRIDSASGPHDISHHNGNGIGADSMRNGCESAPSSHPNDNGNENTQASERANPEDNAAESLASPVSPDGAAFASPTAAFAPEIERQLDWSVRQAAVKRTKLSTSDAGTDADGMSGEDVRNAQKMLQTAARAAPAGEREPDMKITAQILVAVGGPRELIQMLAHLDKRDLSHVQSYGYFLKLAGEHRARQPSHPS